MDAYRHAPTLPVEAALDIFRNSRRRAALAAVTTAEGPYPLSELATEVAASEARKPVTEVTADEYRETKILLHHVDLPKLDERDVVRYDPVEHVVDSNDPPLVGEEWLEVPVTDVLEDGPMGPANI